MNNRMGLSFAVCPGIPARCNLCPRCVVNRSTLERREDGGTRMRDDLGDRMKSHYENRTRYLLPRRTYGIIRIDGKTFHSYTRGLNRPFDTGLMEDMDQTAIALCA